MRRLILAVSIILFMASPALAKPEEPETEVPPWATPHCIETIEKIVQHEVGRMDFEAKVFVAEHVIHDIQGMGCSSLTQWRWRIGEYSTYNISNETRVAVWKTILLYPNTYHCKCRFIGNPSDMKVWAAFGYNVKVGYHHSVGGMTLIGANCEQEK